MSPQLCQQMSDSQLAMAATKALLEDEAFPEQRTLAP